MIPSFRSQLRSLARGLAITIEATIRRGVRRRRCPRDGHRLIRVEPMALCANCVYWEWL